MEIPNTYKGDDYLQLPVLKYFCKEHKLSTTENKAELIGQILDYAAIGDDEQQEVVNWLENVLKEGNKELYVKKAYNLDEVLENEEVIVRKLQSVYNTYEHNVPLINYRNTTEVGLVKVVFEKENEKIKKIELVFSQLFLSGMEEEKVGERVCYPVFVDIYISEGFIIGRSKAKTTLYKVDDEDIIHKINHINTRVIADDIISKIVDLLRIQTDSDERKIKHAISEMQYNLYQKFSYTPEPVKQEIESVRDLSEQFIRQIFEKLSLSPFNLQDAMADIDIFIEKYISINGENEHIFKQDRNAYLVQVKSKDIQEMTTIDTSTDSEKPLQCTDVFFDSKKAITKAKKCENINLCFKRTNSKYYGRSTFNAQFMLGKGSRCGVVKLSRYVEEVDIVNVIQTVFENYG